MAEIVKKYQCSGCHSCFNICPKKCITMQADKDGFLYPVINRHICVNCGKCSEICPILSEYRGNIVGKSYACINKNEKIRLKSSSGGMFTLFAENIINKGGVVFGAAFDEELNVNHIEVVCVEDLSLIRGSKYVQSCIGDTYKKVENYLKQDRLVLFSGTPCQISGLKSYLKYDYENLIMQDIICHGVPSPYVWQRYLDFRKRTAGEDIDKNVFPSFRLKDNGWKNYSLSIKFINRKEYRKIASQDVYFKVFLNNLSLRPSCYNCHSKSLERESDITLADFWGIEEVLPEMFDDRGTSLVLVNSEKGRKLFESIADNIIYKEVDIEDAIKYNPSAIKSVICPKNRNKFMRMIRKMDFDIAADKCLKTSVIKRCSNKFKIVVKRMCNYVQK